LVQKRSIESLADLARDAASNPVNDVVNDGVLGPDGDRRLRQVAELVVRELERIVAVGFAE